MANEPLAEVSVQWNGDAVNLKMLRGLEANHKRATVHLERSVKRNLSTSGRGGLGGNNKSRPGGFPHADRGRLRQSINHGFFEFLVSWVGPVGIPYGRIQELGGIITPKVAKALTVPISDEAKKFLRDGGSARRFPRELVFITRHGRPPLLVEKKRKSKAKGQHFVIHFLLTRRVRLPARPYLTTTLEQEKSTLVPMLTKEVA